AGRAQACAGGSCHPAVAVYPAACASATPAATATATRGSSCTVATVATVAAGSAGDGVGAGSAVAASAWGTQAPDAADVRVAVTHLFAGLVDEEAAASPACSPATASDGEILARKTGN